MSVLKVPSISEHHRSFSDITIVSGIMIAVVTVVSVISNSIGVLPVMVPLLVLLMVPLLVMVPLLLSRVP